MAHCASAGKGFADGPARDFAATPDMTFNNMAVMVQHKPAFDPEAHLHKQGWKGKGTALKDGHATRPLPVVRKKNLAGIGKDRDEAVPFWDNIFATTAASIMSSTTPSAQASPSATPGPSSPGLVVEKPKPKAGLSASTRISREIARRGLYSRFFRGKVVPPPEDEEEDLARTDSPGDAEGQDTPNAQSESRASSSAASSTSGQQEAPAEVKTSRSTRKDREETKEERRARRAEKAAKKVEKAEKKREKEERRAKRAAAKESKGKEGSNKRKRTAEAGAVVEETLAATDMKADKKKKRRKGETDGL